MINILRYYIIREVVKIGEIELGITKTIIIHVD